MNSTEKTPAFKHKQQTKRFAFVQSYQDVTDQCLGENASAEQCPAGTVYYIGKVMFEWAIRF